MPGHPFNFASHLHSFRSRVTTLAHWSRPVSYPSQKFSRTTQTKGFRDSDKEALDVLAYYHADGNSEDPLVQFEYQEIKTAIEEEKLQKRTGWLELVRTPGNRRRMRIIIAIAVFSQWSGNGLV